MANIETAQTGAQLITDYLSQLQPGFLPLPIFHAITRLVTTPSLELILIRMRNDQPEVWLVRRPPDDLFWPSQWHPAGTVLMSTDAMPSAEATTNPNDMFAEPIRRILNDELSGMLKPVSDMKYVTTHFWKVERGTEFSPVYYVEVDYVEQPTGRELNVGQFFPLDNLPTDIIAHYRVVMRDVAERLKASNYLS